MKFKTFLFNLFLLCISFFSVNAAYFGEPIDFGVTRNMSLAHSPDLFDPCDIESYENRLRSPRCPRSSSAIPWSRSRRKPRAIISNVEEDPNHIIIKTIYSKRPILITKFEEVDTGEFEKIIYSSVLVDIINSPVFQRLKLIRQYGPSHFVAKHIIYDGDELGNYTRYEHSLGVLVILILKIPHCDINVLIAGVVHDLGHIPFSHVSDDLFGEGFHDNPERLFTFFEGCGLKEILDEYDIKLDKVFGRTRETFLPPEVKQKGGLLCADNIEYHLTGCYKAGDLDLEQVRKIFSSLYFVPGANIWILIDRELAKEFQNAVCILVENNCNSRWNRVLYKYVARKLRIALNEGIITEENLIWDFDLGDDDLWDRIFPNFSNNLNIIKGSCGDAERNITPYTLERLLKGD